MLSRRILVLAALCALAVPTIAFAAVDADVTVRPRQSQAGKVIRVVAAVVAHEQMTVDGRGRIKVRGKWRPLASEGPRELTPDSGMALKVKPKPRIATMIAQELNDGERLRATITVVLTDSTGEVDSTRYRTKVIRD